MQLPLKKGLFERLDWRRGVFRGWAVGLIAFLFFLFLPQVFAPLISQALNPIFPIGSFDLVLVLGSAGIFVLMSLGLNVVVGFAGLLDLGYAAFFAIGAYSYGLANLGTAQVGDHTLKFAIWPLLLAAPVIAAMFGIILGAPTLRLRGDYLAIVTLGFGEIVPIVFQNISQVSWNLPLVGPVSFNLGGANGFLGLDRPATLNLPFQTIMFTLNDSANFYYLVFGLVMLRKSRIGRAWVAIREDETAAACSGVNLVATKLTAFAIGASVSGFAGVLYGSQYGVISPESFMFVVSITILVMIVLGGMGSIPGVITGALILGLINRLIVVVPTLFQNPDSLLYVSSRSLQEQIPRYLNDSQSLIYGIILLLVILLRPQGLIPSAIRKRELKGESLAVVEKEGSKVLMEVPSETPESSAEIGAFEELELAQAEVVVESLDRSGEGSGYDASPGLGGTSGGASK